MTLQRKKSLRPLVAYVRVSTSRQGRSGLGIEAQRQALSQFAEADGFKIADEYVEVESGKGADRKSTRLNSSHSRASRMPSSA